MTVVRAYHGTWHEFEAFDRTKDIGFHFGSRWLAENRIDMILKEDPASRKLSRAGGLSRVVACDVELGNCLVSLDDPMRWDGHHVLALVRPHIGEDRYRAAVDTYLERRARGDTEGAFVVSLVKDVLQGSGYHSIAYRNMYEGSTRARAGSVDWSFVVLDPQAIRIVDRDYRGACESTVPRSIIEREKQIANWRSRRCTFRYKKSREAFSVGFRSMMTEFGAEVTPSQPAWRNSLEGKFDLDGNEVHAVADVEIGNVVLRLPFEVGPEISKLGDRNSWDRGWKNGFDLTWQGTETVEEFYSRTRSVLEQLRAALEFNAGAGLRFG